MPSKQPAILSAIITFLLLGFIGFLIFVVQTVALNGVIDESKAFQSLGFGLFCQVVSMLFAAVFAGWFTNTLILRYDWNKVGASVAAIILGTLLGAAISLVSTVVSIPLAGIH
jgi:hypothetical protein